MPRPTNVFLWLLPLLLLQACGGSPEREATSGDDAAEVALRMVGKPYRFGGNTPSRGFDCSGLVHYSYSQTGRNVPRTTHAQRSGSRFVARDRMRRGDLVFFNQEGKWSSHVGIYIGDNRFVHAPSSGKKVRVDKITDPYWQRSLVDVRRF